MSTTILSPHTIKGLSSKLLSTSIPFWLLIYGLAIFQDYLFARLRSTGFYWPESMLYNSFWMLFIPLLLLVNKLYSKFPLKSLITKIIYLSISGILFSAIHALLFAALFSSISILIFSPPHRFLTILNSVLSNQLYISLVVYSFVPAVLDYMKRNKVLKESVRKFSNQISLKTHKGWTILAVSSIEFLSTERPYTIIHADDNKYYLDDSLKKLENLFDPTIFYRVHRSAIVNKNHIKELKSRKNGDFDAMLTNGLSVRFSRHYRKNWHKLILQ